VKRYTYLIHVDTCINVSAHLEQSVTRQSSSTEEEEEEEEEG